MSSPARLAVGQIVYVEIPGQDPHPAVVVLDLGDGGYVVVNGTGSPDDATPVVSLSAPAARTCGLTKATNFYGTAKYVWYWRPSGELPAPVGRMLATYVADLRAAAIEVMKAMKHVSVEIGKLPPDCGVRLEHLKQLKALAAAGATHASASTAAAPVKK